LFNIPVNSAVCELRHVQNPLQDRYYMFIETFLLTTVNLFADDYDMADKRTTDIISDISEMAELSTSTTASLSRKRFHGERSLLVESKRRRIENSPIPDGDDYSIASHSTGSASTITVTSGK
jgi:hypothetical protein